MQLGLMIWPVQWDLWGFNQDELGHISMHICHTASGISNIRIWNIRIWNIRIWHIRIWHIRIWNSYAKEFFFPWNDSAYGTLTVLAGWDRFILQNPYVGKPRKKTQTFNAADVGRVVEDLVFTTWISGDELRSVDLKFGKRWVFIHGWHVHLSHLLNVSPWVIMSIRKRNFLPRSVLIWFCRTYLKGLMRLSDWKLFAFQQKYLHTALLQK
jgi:hypothetical protein